MAFAEKLLQCIDCRKTFTFSVAEQEFHASRGFPNAPCRCPACRLAKKTRHVTNENASEDFLSRRQVFQVTCTQCGKVTQVPFQPRKGEPVYCSNCFIKSRAGR